MVLKAFKERRYAILFQVERPGQKSLSQSYVRGLSDKSEYYEGFSVLTYFRKAILLVLIGALSTAFWYCRSDKVVIQIYVSNHNNSVPTSGEACGFKGFSIPGFLIFDFIPVNYTNRMHNAMQDALQKVPGSKNLVNVSIEEVWYYWIVAQTRCVRVWGDAIK